jgi:MFS family permease
MNKHNETVNQQPLSGKTLGLLFLLALSVFINYVDRGNLSVAAPLLKGELHLTASQLGILLGAFFWTYTALMIVAGWMVSPLKWQAKKRTLLETLHPAPGTPANST